MNKIIKLIKVSPNETVEIQWNCLEGIYIERRTCPPKSIRESKQTNDGTEKSKME